MANTFLSEIGTYPPAWSIQRVDSLFHIQQGKSVSKVHRQGDNQKPFLRTKNIFWGNIDFSELDHMHFTSQEEARLKLQTDDLLLCEGGDVGRTAIWNNQMEGCYYQNHLHRLRAKQASEIDAKFALYWFWYAFAVGNIYVGRSNVTTIPNLSQSKLGELHLPKPSLDEQRRIALYLTTVHTSIEQQARLINLTRELKSTLMKKLFTEGLNDEKLRESEIGLVPESWKIVTFSEGVDIKNGQVDPREEPYSSMIHVGPENIERDTGRLLFLKINKELGIKSGNYYFNDGDILYSKIRPYLNKVALPDFEGTCSADMYPLKAKKELFDRHYLFQLMLSETFKKQAISHQDRTGIPKINRNQLGSILLTRPSLAEQVEIAKLLGMFDGRIAIAERRRNLLEELFRTLLHQLMTARISLNNLKIPELS